MDDTLRAIIFGGLAAGNGLLVLLVSRVLSPRQRTEHPDKLDTYECGVPLQSSAREKVPMSFYLLAIFFVVFDVEVLFLIPWAVEFRALGLAGLVEMGAFVAVLGIGLFYIWKRGALVVEER